MKMASIVRGYIAQYAEDHEMTTREVLRFLSQRTSIEVAAELIGIVIPVSRAALVDKQCALPILLELRRMFENCHLTVPRFFEYEDSNGDGRCRRHNVGLEEYLVLREQGLSRSQAKHMLFRGNRTFYIFLEQHGIRDKMVEQYTVERFRATHSLNSTASA